ncbi:MULTISPECIES: BspA family leucine-rich repeat surface protein [unclassified Enterococcus]|uniref:BspA family leucine-rich repeat surface protein n=1 Tax=unclassified Enterococcus TaxID=2608891 RepID=UPI001F1F6B81|nr:MULTISPECIES: BspA family leucine-rich repeat surface protein [unclassified Enterococcus]
MNDMKRVISIGFLGRFLLITVLFLSHVPFQLVNASTEVFDSLNDFESESSNIKEGEEELDESESEPEKANEGSRSTQYRIDLIANPPRGGTAINLATNSTVIWGDVGMGVGNVTAIPNTGYHFVEWEVVSGPVNLLSPTNLFPALIMGAGNSVVQAMFAPVQGGNIIVKHEDAEGNKLVEDEILAGLFDEEYSTEALTIEGWNVSRIPSNASGTFTQEEQVVLYLYERYEPQQNLWGTVPWGYDEEAESIILYGGIAGSVTEAPWRTYTSVKQITIENIVVLPENSRGLFSSLNNLETIEHAENLDVSNVENMYNMFGAARSIKHLDVSRWDTSNVRNMSFMFNQTQSLKELDVSNWDTSQVTNMQAMFQNAESLTTLDVSSWNTSQIIDMSFMFSQTRSLKELDVSNWDTSQATDMRAMFQGSSLTTLDVSRWNTSRVTNMGFMFNQMQSLKEVDVGNWDTSQVTNMRMMFNNGNSLTTLDVSRWNTSQITDMGFMFNQMRSLKELDMSNWDTSQVTNMQSMFGNTNALNRITLGEQSIFSAAANLPAIPSTEQYTGRWTLEENLSGDGSVITFENSTEFMANYDGSSPGTYIWERVAPEQLVASIDRVSDQSQTITGYATESVDELTISYQTTSGDKVVLEKDDPRIVWGDYQESNQHVRQFQIDLIGNERLETETKVTITVSKPSVVTTGDRTEEQTVIKGIDYRANNLTLDRFKINELSTQEELDALILQESRAQAANVLSEADMTDDFRIVETDLTRGVDEDGSYFAVLEVGNKAYQLIVGIDVTSKLEYLRVTIPTKMVFESLYNTAESNRNFESQGYEIRNQSPLAVDTYINQLAIDDPAGIVLLEEGEDPLDYAESEEEDPTLTYDDISTPLLRLNLKTEETQIQLYETMEEQHLVRLEERSRVPISLTGDFYGDYPQWVVDSEADQGGYYEDLLVPNYRIVLRFVPRD